MNKMFATNEMSPDYVTLPLRYTNLVFVQLLNTQNKKIIFLLWCTLERVFESIFRCFISEKRNIFLRKWVLGLSIHCQVKDFRLKSYLMVDSVEKGSSGRLDRIIWIDPCHIWILGVAKFEFSPFKSSMKSPGYLFRLLVAF